MRPAGILIVFFIVLTGNEIPIFSQAQTVNQDHLFIKVKPSSSPFSTALETLQTQIGYKFQNIGLLRRAMTHSSFSEENNKALGIFGKTLISTSVSLQCLNKNIDMPGKDLNARISEISNVESSCAVDAMRLELEKVVRVSPKTNSSVPTVVCGAFRAIFGAIAVDSGKSDVAGDVFVRVHGGHIGEALAM
ncbi:Ribonuclease III domain [Dillenia turbinata]|uniref:Ribonuclease III domain n=1 Tax=Dillenia turbinata TaxID=194707 RepID=A0AAN8UZW2_9MAGN